MISSFGWGKLGQERMEVGVGLEISRFGWYKGRIMYGAKLWRIEYFNKIVTLQRYKFCLACCLH
jgi:hypothetical protein